LTEGTFLDKGVADIGSPDKAKPSVKWGWKAAGLLGRKMAELLKDESLVSSAFLFPYGATH
jgi:hypothetical protein